MIGGLRRRTAATLSNRSPAAPKPIRIMRPCTCANHYAECNCEWLARTKPAKMPGSVFTLVVLAVSVVGVSLWYLFRG